MKVQWGGGILSRKNPKGLQRFDKNKKLKTIFIGSTIGILLIIGGISLYRAFALYKIERTFNVLEGVVPDFRNKTPLIQSVKLGDYVEVVPTSTSYIISKNLTGYTTDQEINPSELTIWRVIKINEDHTIELVAENTSSVPLYLTGQTAYIHLISLLNQIANSYQNADYTLKTRYLGYSNQTEILSQAGNVSLCGVQRYSYSSVTTATETKGCGDYGYFHDIGNSSSSLLDQSLENYIATNVKTKEAVPYYLASRYYSSWSWNCSGSMILSVKSVTAAGVIIGDSERNTDGLYLYQTNDPTGASTSCGGKNRISSAYLRPVIVLKENVSFQDGNGTEDSPYRLK